MTQTHHQKHIKSQSSAYINKAGIKLPAEKAVDLKQHGYSKDSMEPIPEFVTSGKRIEIMRKSTAMHLFAIVLLKFVA
jgi:hypothetical protein